MTVKSKVAILIFGFSFILSCNFTVKALDQFSTDYEITYDINDAGETTVKQKVFITNQIEDVIATKYSLSINNMAIYEEKAYEENENINLKKELTQDTITLTALFEKYTVGKDKTKEFIIEYKTRDLAYRSGKIWSINIPRAQIPDSAKKYTVTLKIPQTFGNKLFISPQPTSKPESNTYVFLGNDLKNMGITAAFGEYQIINFKIKYEIENPWWINAIYDVALPPDITGVQQISFGGLEPAPTKIYLDSDGNTIARYKLKRKEKLAINLTGTAKISARQIDVSRGGNIDDVSKQILSSYTKSTKYWESNDELIQKLAKELYAKDQNVSQNAQKIYNYLVSNFSYDKEIVNSTSKERQGALLALKNKQNLACMEFTDSFIAISRAMDIPSREINGYAFSSNEKSQPLSINLNQGDFLHSWAEFYDPSFGWVQIDPTWGNTSGIDYFTKLDTNHFALVIRGKSSLLPLPAGAYRTTNDKKLLDIGFDQENIDSRTFTERLTIKKRPNFNLFRILLNQNKYLVVNTGSVAVGNINDKFYLAPHQSKEVYLSKKIRRLSYKTFDGTNAFVQIQE